MSDRRSTLTGWVPRIGEYVWQQMYSPQHPANDSTITERIEHGSLYMDRRLQVVVDVVPNYEGRKGHTRWQTRKPGRDLGPAHHSHTENDWCVLESATPAEVADAVRNARPDRADPWTEPETHGAAVQPSLFAGVA